MADQTVSTNLTIGQVIANGLLDGENITVDSGAVLTFDQSPTVLLGNIVINDGTVLLDGANVANPIIICGEESSNIQVNAPSTLRATLGWWTAPTTGDGTSNRSIDISTYFTDDVNAQVTADAIPGCWVETGRRIDYDGGAGAIPVVGQWVQQVGSDGTVYGPIVEVGAGSTIASGYVVVKWLAGATTGNTALDDDDNLEVVALIDQLGDTYDILWTGQVNNVLGDIREAGIFTEFANARAGGVDQMANFGPGMTGFVYDQDWQTDNLVFGDGVNGFIPPNNAEIRLPNVHLSTSTTAAFPTTTWNTAGSNTVEFLRRYRIEMQGSGDIDLNGMLFGSAVCEDSNIGSFLATFCAAGNSFGGRLCPQQVQLTNCILTGDNQSAAQSGSRRAWALRDLSGGAVLTDCLTILPTSSGNQSLGALDCGAITLTRCLFQSAGLVSEFENCVNLTLDNCMFAGTVMAFTGCTTVNVNDHHFSFDQGGGAGNLGTYAVVNCSAIFVNGFDLREDSTTTGNVGTIFNGSDIKLRNFGMIDRKQAVGAADDFCDAGGQSTLIDIARIWLSDANGSNEFVETSSTVNGLITRNCSKEFPSAVEPRGTDVSHRGLHSASGNFGNGPAGVQSDYILSFGGNAGDVFRSNTTGAFYFVFIEGSALNPIQNIVGSPTFLRDGHVNLLAGEAFEVEMPYFANGHVDFTGVVTLLSGAGAPQTADGSDNWGALNADCEFQFDNGTGYNGTWLDARTAANLTAITNAVDGLRMKIRVTALLDIDELVGVMFLTNTTIADQKANLYAIDQADPDVIELNNLVGDYVYIRDNNGSQALYQANVTGQLIYQLPDGSVGTWTIVVNRPGFTPFITTITAGLSQRTIINVSLNQEVTPEGAPLYTGTSSADLAIDYSGANPIIDVGNAAAGPQLIYDEVQDEEVLVDGMAWLAGGGGSVFYVPTDTGNYIILTTGWRFRRAAVTDVNAIVQAFVRSPDAQIVDGVNGDVFIESAVGGADPQAVRDAMELSSTSGQAPIDIKLNNNLGLAAARLK